ncbi:MAG: GHKL domain-containing protein, partial [Phycisphaerales bacterium]
MTKTQHHDIQARDADSNPARHARGLIESLPVALVIFDRDLQVLARNRLAETLLPAHDNIADSLTEAGHDSSFQDWPAILRRAIDAQRQARFENVAFRLPTVDPGFLNIAVSPLFDDRNECVTGGVLVAEDVTARMSMEQRLAVSERMAALGKLASRVAHELNNPLDGILRYINLALRVIDTPDRAKAARYLTECRRGLQRMVGIVSDLLEFSRSTRASFGAGSINEVVEEALRSYEAPIREHRIAVVCSFNENVPTVRGNNLFQVFCNLIKNAIDAMTDGGTLTITTDLRGPLVDIIFEDTGVGLPEEQERIFDPFFTTKEPGKGTGLGLSICKEIVERYQGRITAHRRDGGGTAFRIQIPLESCGPAAR